MYLNQFSVRVVGGNEVAGGYVEMTHGKTYSLQLRNDRDVPCDARVEIDGEHVGTWRINRRDTIPIERPVHDTGKFTFYQLGTPEGVQVRLNPNNPDLGLVRVTFTPQLVPQRPRVVPAVLGNSYTAGTPMADPGDASGGDWVTNATLEFNTGSETVNVSNLYTADRGGSAQSLTAGGTGLSGESQQVFVTVGELEYDLSQQTVINLRLVCRGDNTPRPLVAHSTPVPPRI